MTPLNPAVGEAIASNPALNTNCGAPNGEHQQWKKKAPIRNELSGAFGYCLLTDTGL